MNVIVGSTDGGASKPERANSSKLHCCDLVPLYFTSRGTKLLSNILDIKNWHRCIKIFFGYSDISYLRDSCLVLGAKTSFVNAVK